LQAKKRLIIVAAPPLMAGADFYDMRTSLKNEYERDPQWLRLQKLHW